MTKLNAEEHAEAMTQLRKRFPDMTDGVLEGLLRGEAPLAPQRKETDPSPGLQQCLALANDLYSKALDATKEITNPIAKAVARAVALGVYGVAMISCYDNNS